MSNLDDFLNETIARQVEAETALHNGDPEPRLAVWSTQDSVTLLGAATSKSGADEVRQFFRFLASQFSDPTSTAARTASGRSSTATATPLRSSSARSLRW